LKAFFETTGWIRQFKLSGGNVSPEEMETSILELAGTIGESRFREQAAGILADIIHRAEIIPDTCQEYRPVVQDGILFFISKLPLERLAGLVALQVNLDEDADAGQRLIELAKQIPTFHKLGQIIARNRHLDPRVRAWLVQLENGNYGTEAEGLCRMIEDRLGPNLEKFRIRLEKKVLSEASVGGVVPFRWFDPDAEEERDGVFKVLKPDIETRLGDELAALDNLADYFEARRHLYSVGKLRFRELFLDVKAALREELDLDSEQVNLSLARQFYNKNRQIHVPRVAPFSSRFFTGMSRVDGGKVSDVLVCREDRQQAADTIFRAIVCDPLFSAEEFPIFHGDPHAGNIFSAGRSSDGELTIALLDWSQTGCLARRWRIGILKFIQGVILGEDVIIGRAMETLSSDNAGEFRAGFITASIKRVMALDEYRESPLMKKAFVMLEQLSFQGIRFHRDLLLFRKAFFTLDGLLHDLDPEFNMDHAVMTYIRDLIIGELPRRLAALIVPISDAPEKYRSMLSNRDLQMLLLGQAIEIVKKNTHRVRAFMERNAGMFDSRSYMPKLFRSRTAKVLLGLYYLCRMQNADAES
jgi:ubiquinone biosynthesis protein